MKTSTTLSLLALTLSSVFAKTDLEGCTSSETVAFGGASMVYWDPTNGEICSFLDCGGGRAPPKTTVPGCPQYEGTATYSPDFLPGWGAQETGASSAVLESSIAESKVTHHLSGYVEVTKTAESGIVVVTSPATLPTLVGTGRSSTLASVTTGANNVTGSLTPSASVPVGTGAAGLVGVAEGLVGLAVGVVGLAVL